MVVVVDIISVLFHSRMIVNQWTRSRAANLMPRIPSEPNPVLCLEPGQKANPYFFS
jgi:hypothetical protein